MRNGRTPRNTPYTSNVSARGCPEYIAQMSGPGTRLKPVMKANPPDAYPPAALSWMGN
jgi:hypothetical protein